jgi:HPt (histidine-containing phosphotransfer) domain-containing protein
MGDIRLEAGDVVTVRDTAGESYTVPCLNLVHTYDGGLMTTITAPGASTTEQEAAFTGSLAATVKQTATELLVAKKVVATKIEAVEADVGKLVAENAEIKTAVIGKADISDVNAANAAIEQLQAVDATLQDALINKANVTDLTAVNANLQNVTADVANINSLLAGSAGVGTLQAIHLTSDNVVIDDATITSAMIADLAASKITSGTLDTNKVAIQSDSGNLIIKDNTIQAADKSSVVRVQIGEDGNGDYNLYLWDTDGNLLWDAGGVTSSGLHDGIIKDVNVATDAALLRLTAARSLLTTPRWRRRTRP